MKTLLNVTAVLSTLVLILAAPCEAGVLGNDDLSWVAILDNAVSANNDHVDLFNAHTQAFVNNGVTLVGSNTQGASSITDSNTPGTLYSISTAGHVWEIDTFKGTASQIVDLAAPASGTGSGHTKFDSITNLPGSDLLYILRTGSGSDYVDSFDPNTLAHVHNVLVTNSGTGGAIAISDGPAYAPFGTGPALYAVATGGSFDALDPSGAVGTGVLLSNGTAGMSAGSMVSLTNLPGVTDGMFIIQDRTGGDNTDRIHKFKLDGTRDIDVYSTTHTGGSFITDSARPGYLFSGATGGSVSHVNQSTYTGSDLSSGTSVSYQSGTNVPAGGPERFVYVADDGTANHTDVFDTRYRHNNGYFSNVLTGGATTTGAPGSGEDWQDTSVTDAASATDVWQLHTDGKLYRVDSSTGVQTLVTTLTPPSGETDLTTYDSVTNLPGTNKLYILRTDRPLNAKVGGTAADRVDVYDIDTDTYTPSLWTPPGTGAVSISDGPAYQQGGDDYGAEPAIYVIASGGSFDVLDPESPGTILRIRGGRDPGDSSGDFISLTNVIGEDGGMYVLRDRAAGDGTDRIDFFALDGTETFDLYTMVMTGASSITDTYEGDLFAIANGDSSALVELDSGTVTDLTGVSTHGDWRTSVTNIANIPEPCTLALAALGAVGLLRRRR